MPNWCSTGVVIKSNDKQLVESIREKMESGYNIAENWQGKIIEKFGLNPDDFQCRSFIESISDKVCLSADGEYFIVVWQEDAWSPKIEFYEYLCNTMFPDLNMCYTAVEEGNEIYINTDISGMYFPTRYMLCVEDEGEEEYETLQDIIADLNGDYHLDMPASTEMTEVVLWVERERGGRIAIYKFEEE